jgi:Papain family cysteine protease
MSKHWMHSVVRFASAAAICSAIIGYAAARLAQAQESQAPTIYQQRLEAASGDVKQRIRAIHEQGREKGWTFPIAYTAVADRTIESLTGGRPPTPEMVSAIPEINALAATIIELYSAEVSAKGLTTPASACKPSLSEWDWRVENKVSPVRRPQACSNCWAFSTAGQIESAFLMAAESPGELSRQQIVDCSHAEVDPHDCNQGGYQYKALTFGVKTALATELQYPYDGTGQEANCKTAIVGTYKLLAAGWVHGAGDVPSPRVLKNALCQYGPITVGIFATPAFQLYGGDGGYLTKTRTIMIQITL